MQLVRLAPPGFGGVERVAHELALFWQSNYQTSIVYSFSSVPSATNSPASYRTIHLPSISFCRFFLPSPSLTLLRLLFSQSPLHIHLPSPSILFLAILARLARPTRHITVHWHSFLQSRLSPLGLAYALYQSLALRSLSFFPRVVTTSPVLRHALIKASIPSSKVFVLPCSISNQYEISTPVIDPPNRHTFNLVYVGRLASYKRVDWLIRAVAEADAQINLLSIDHKPRLILNVIGSGPNFHDLYSLADKLSPSRCFFHGRLSEQQKIAILQESDLLVLPSDSCHEAFGIVQLEAMSLGVPALAFSRPLSGASWVSSVHSLPSVCNRSELSSQILRLAIDVNLQRRARSEARQRYLSVFSRQIWYRNIQQIFDLNM